METNTVSKAFYTQKLLEPMLETRPEIDKKPADAFGTDEFTIEFENTLNNELQVL